jgi:hypothetical protein
VMEKECLTAKDKGREVYVYAPGTIQLHRAILTCWRRDARQFHHQAQIHCLLHSTSSKSLWRVCSTMSLRFCSENEPFRALTGPSSLCYPLLGKPPCDAHY